MTRASDHVKEISTKILDLIAFEKPEDVMDALALATLTFIKVFAVDARETLNEFADHLKEQLIEKLDEI